MLTLTLCTLALATPPDLTQAPPRDPQATKALVAQLEHALEWGEVSLIDDEMGLFLTVADPVQFQPDEARLPWLRRFQVDEVASLLREHPELEVAVVGHAPAHRPGLGDARAHHVRHLLQKRGIDGTRLRAVDMGANPTGAQTPTFDDDELLHRVEIRLLPELDPALVAALAGDRDALSDQVLDDAINDASADASR